jgi:hypothetical protein
MFWRKKWKVRGNEQNADNLKNFLTGCLTFDIHPTSPAEIVIYQGGTWQMGIEIDPNSVGKPPKGVEYRGRDNNVHMAKMSLKSPSIGFSRRPEEIGEVEKEIDEILRMLDKNKIHLPYYPDLMRVPAKVTRVLNGFFSVSSDVPFLDIIKNPLPDFLGKHFLEDIYPVTRGSLGFFTQINHRGVADFNYDARFTFENGQGRIGSIGLVSNKVIPLARDYIAELLGREFGESPRINMGDIRTGHNWAVLDNTCIEYCTEKGWQTYLIQSPKGSKTVLSIGAGEGHYTGGAGDLVDQLKGLEALAQDLTAHIVTPQNATGIIVHA